MRYEFIYMYVATLTLTFSTVKYECDYLMLYSPIACRLHWCKEFDGRQYIEDILKIYHHHASIQPLEDLM